MTKPPGERDEKYNIRKMLKSIRHSLKHETGPIALNMHIHQFMGTRYNDGGYPVEYKQVGRRITLEITIGTQTDIHTEQEL